MMIMKRKLLFSFSVLTIFSILMLGNVNMIKASTPDLMIIVENQLDIDILIEYDSGVINESKIIKPDNKAFIQIVKENGFNIKVLEYNNKDNIIVEYTKFSSEILGNETSYTIIINEQVARRGIFIPFTVIEIEETWLWIIGGFVLVLIIALLIQSARLGVTGWRLGRAQKKVTRLKTQKEEKEAAIKKIIGAAKEGYKLGQQSKLKTEKKGFAKRIWSKKDKQ